MNLLPYPHHNSGTHEPDDARHGKDTHDSGSPSIIPFTLSCGVVRQDILDAGHLPSLCPRQKIQQ